MKGMKKILLLVVSLTMIVGFAVAGAKKKEYARSNADGMCLVKVWSYSKKSRIAADQCRKNAVHGIMFKGYSASDGTTVSQRPLVKDAAALTDKAEFFDAFFADGGPYGQIVSAVTDGSMEVRKVGKQYKVGVVVTVSKDQLRKYLEDAGVIRSLTSGF